MSVYSKFLSLVNGASRTVDLSTNTLSVQGLQINAATGGGAITQAAHSATTSYSIIWPQAQAAMSGYVLTNDGAGNLSWSATSSPLIFADSLVNTGGTVTLVNDTASPGASQYYGTNASSVLGYYNLPVSGINQLTGDVTAGPGTGSQVATLATVNSNVGSFGSSTSIPSFTVNAKGLITAASGNAVIAPAGTLSGTTLNSTVVTSSLTSLGTQSQALNMGSNQIHNVADPTSAQDAATKNYVDTLSQGISWKQHVQAISTSALPSNTYNNGSSGVGATLTATTNAALVVDGYTVQTGDRLIVAGEATQSHNGIYTVTNTGSGAAAYVLTRSLDMDLGTQFPSAAAFVDNGTANTNTAWVQTTVGTITIGTTNIVWAKFASATPYTFTNGLQQVGQTISVEPSDTSLTTSGSGVQVNFNSTGALSTSSGVKVNTDGTSIDVNGSNQLEIKAAGVTTSKLGTITDGVTLDQSGAGSTLEIKTAGVGTTQLAAASVTTAKLGTITDGTTLDQSGAGSTLEIKTAGVGTTQLANASVTAAKLGSVTDGITTDQNGSGSTIEVLNSPAMKRILVAGQSFTANTSYAVRWGLTANGETANRVYAADITTSSFDLFYVIGMASSGTSVSAGQNITVTTMGSFSLSSSDTAFASNTDGAPVFLTATGTFSTTAPSSSGQAVTRIGMVQQRSGTVTSNIIDVLPQTIGVN